MKLHRRAAVGLACSLCWSCEWAPIGFSEGKWFPGSSVLPNLVKELLVSFAPEAKSLSSSLKRLAGFVSGFRSILCAFSLMWWFLCIVDAWLTWRLTCTLFAQKPFFDAESKCLFNYSINSPVNLLTVSAHSSGAIHSVTSLDCVASKRSLLNTDWTCLQLWPLCTLS